MKIKLLPDAPTEHRCDACQRMFPAGTLVDDRGRFVCQKCYDTMNPPEEPGKESLPFSADARTAIICAVVGVIIYGISFNTRHTFLHTSLMFNIAAIRYAIEAIRQIKINPKLCGIETAVIAIVMSCAVILSAIVMNHFMILMVAILVVIAYRAKMPERPYQVFKLK